MDDLKFQTDLIEHKIYDAWQFIVNARKNIEIAEYCLSVIKETITKKTKYAIKWQQDLFSDLSETKINGKTVFCKDVMSDDLPSRDIYVAGIKTDYSFLIGKLIRDFFQYARNLYDSIAQITNRGLLANSSTKTTDYIDFISIKKELNKDTCKTIFSSTFEWFKCVSESNEFKYIDDINNRTKHTAEVETKLSIGLLGSSNIMKIKPFFKKSTQHNEHDLIDQLEASIDFLKNSFQSFLDSFINDYKKDAYVNGRLNCIKKYFQNITLPNPYGYAMIEENSDFDSMPNTIYLLFATVRDNRVYSHNSPFDFIYVVKSSDVLDDIVGRYIRKEDIHEDCLCNYIRYEKDLENNSEKCTYFAQNTLLEHTFIRNPYFDVLTFKEANQ